MPTGKTPQQAVEFTRMRRHEARQFIRPVQHFRIVRQHGQGIGIDHGRQLPLGHHRQNLLLVVKAESRSDRQRIEAHLQNIAVVIDQHHHDLGRHAGGDQQIRVLLHQQRHQSRPSTQSAQACKLRRTEKSA